MKKIDNLLPIIILQASFSITHQYLNYILHKLNSYINISQHFDGNINHASFFFIKTTQFLTLINPSRFVRSKFIRHINHRSIDITMNYNLPYIKAN